MTVTHRKKLGVKYHCDACRKDVSDISRIKCAICEDFDLCVECFASGVQVSTHLPSHPYRVIDTLMFPIFEDTWGAEEEVLLMEGLEKYGMGNWTDVAEHVGTKTMLQVEEHYYNVFVNSPYWPLPIMTTQFTPQNSPRKRPRPPTTLVKTEPPKKTKVITSQPCNHEIAGYMPGRGEFETDYGNELEETCLKELQFDKTDTPEERLFKLTIIDIYNDKLEKKMERKKFIFERNLQEYKKITAEERKKSKEERDLLNQMKVFARMMTPEDFSLFMEGLRIENKLKENIQRLQEYRRAGNRTYSEAHRYEQEKALKFDVRPSLPVIPPPPPILSLIQPTLPSSSSSSSSSSSTSSSLHPLASTPSISTPFTSTSKNAIRPEDRPIGRKPPNSLDISESECVHLLSDREKSLCSTLRILPKIYLTIKETLLSEYAKTGSLRRRQARTMIKMDVNKTGKIYNFFVEMGWIKQALRKVE